MDFLSPRICLLFDSEGRREFLLQPFSVHSCCAMRVNCVYAQLLKMGGIELLPLMKMEALTHSVAVRRKRASPCGFLSNQGMSG